MIRIVRSDWQGAVLICGKCSRKIGGGFGKKGRVPLAKALRGLWGKGRKATRGAVETKCLGVCPRNAVVAVDTARPDSWLVVPAGTDIHEIAAELGA